MGLLASALEDVRGDRQVARANFAAFKSLVATPGNLVTGIALPAGADVYVSSTSVLAVTTRLVDAGDRQLNAPAQAANRLHRLGYLERGVTVIKAAGAPGTVRVYIRNGIKAPVLFGQG